MNKFPCDCCGACCKNIKLAAETAYLDRGDGICRHFNDESNLCSIYNNRPDICRVDFQYLTKYSTLISWEDFINLNQQACNHLKNIDTQKNNK